MMSPRKILIRNRQTNKLFRNRRLWTDDPKKARTFDSALAAFYFAADANLHDIEIVWLRSPDVAPEQIIAPRAQIDPVITRPQASSPMQLSLR